MEALTSGAVVVGDNLASRVFGCVIHWRGGVIKVGGGQERYPVLGNLAAGLGPGHLALAWALRAAHDSLDKIAKLFVRKGVLVHVQ